MGPLTTFVNEQFLKSFYITFMNNVKNCQKKKGVIFITFLQFFFQQIIGS